MYLRNMRIGTRLWTSFGIILGILVLMVRIGNGLNAKNKQKLLNALEVSNKKSISIGVMKSALTEKSVIVRTISRQSDIENIQNINARVAEENNRYAVANNQLTALGLNEREKFIIDQINRLDTEILGHFDKVTKQILASDAEGAEKTIFTNIDGLVQSVLAEMDKLVALQDSSASEILATSVVDDDRLMVLTAFIGTICLLIGGAFAWIITRSITKPLNDAVKFASLVATGDLTAKIDERSKDEIGQLFNAGLFEIQFLRSTQRGRYRQSKGGNYRVG